MLYNVLIKLNIVCCQFLQQNVPQESKWFLVLFSYVLKLKFATNFVTYMGNVYKNW